jgi:subtilisin family serine protease
MVMKRMGLFALVVFWAASASAARRIVKFAPGTSPADRVSLAQAAGGTVVRELPLIDAVVVETHDAQVRVAEARLRALREVVRVDEDPRINWLALADARGVDFRVPALGAIIKPFHPSQELPPADVPAPAGQDTPWGITRVQAPQAWSSSKGAGVKLVVIDTGIDRTHPDLAPRLRGGWNAVTKNDDFTDDNGHGSHCSGTIAAADDAAGVVGVAPEVELYGVKVLDAGGSGTFDDVIAGMQWAVQNHMQVASMSLGASSGNQALQDAVAAMEAGGVTLIAAAGNSGAAVGYPAAYPGAIAVAASDNRDRLAYFSSRGPQVAVIAPGVAVKSTWMGGGYNTISGTSMATPHVAGLAALYVSRHPGARPADVRAALSAASVRLPDVIPEGQGAGLPLAPALAR